MSSLLTHSSPARCKRKRNGRRLWKHRLVGAAKVALLGTGCPLPDASLAAPCCSTVLCERGSTNVDEHPRHDPTRDFLLCGVELGRAPAAAPTFARSADKGDAGGDAANALDNCFGELFRLLRTSNLAFPKFYHSLVALDSLAFVGVICFRSLWPRRTRSRPWNLRLQFLHWLASTISTKGQGTWNEGRLHPHLRMLRNGVPST